MRRLSPSIRYDATGGVVTDLNTAWGFCGPVGSYTWRLLGERRMLGVLHARHYPLEWCPGGGDFAPCDAWEERAAYVVEETARKPYDIYGKRVVVVDKQSWAVLATDLFDKTGALWKTCASFWSYRPYARGGDGAEEVDYLLGGTCLDLREQEANRWRLPGTRSLADAVSINAGLEKDRFTAAALPDAMR